MVPEGDHELRSNKLGLYTMDRQLIGDVDFETLAHLLALRRINAHIRSLLHQVLKRSSQQIMLFVVKKSQ